MKKKFPIEVVEDDLEVTSQVLASTIVNISEGIKRLRAGPLSDRALLLLIQDACPDRLGIDKIRMVLDAVGELRDRYVRKPK